MRCALALLLVACSEPAPPPTGALLFTRTLGYRHEDAIVAALETLPARLEADGFDVTATEDPVAFANLDEQAVVIFLYTSGNDLLDADQRVAFERYVASGGGWVGVHSAADTEYLWPFYQSLVIAPFSDHPVIQDAAVLVEDPVHPALSHLPAMPWVASDEWYNFGRHPRVDGVSVLATLDEASYTGGTMGADHPIVWAHERLGGRALYTGLGHVAARWSDPAFVDHITGAVGWARR